MLFLKQPNGILKYPEKICFLQDGLALSDMYFIGSYGLIFFLKSMKAFILDLFVQYFSQLCFFTNMYLHH